MTVGIALLAVAAFLLAAWLGTPVLAGVGAVLVGLTAVRIIDLTVGLELGAAEFAIAAAIVAFLFRVAARGIVHFSARYGDALRFTPLKLRIGGTTSRTEIFCRPLQIASGFACGTGVAALAVAAFSPSATVVVAAAALAIVIGLLASDLVRTRHAGPEATATVGIIALAVANLGAIVAPFAADVAWSLSTALFVVAAFGIVAVLLGWRLPHPRERSEERRGQDQPSLLEFWRLRLAGYGRVIVPITMVAAVLPALIVDPLAGESFTPNTVAWFCAQPITLLLIASFGIVQAVIGAGVRRSPTRMTFWLGLFFALVVATGLLDWLQLPRVIAYAALLIPMALSLPRHDAVDARGVVEGTTPTLFGVFGALPLLALAGMMLSAGGDGTLPSPAQWGVWWLWPVSVLVLAVAACVALARQRTMEWAVVLTGLVFAAWWPGVVTGSWQPSAGYGVAAVLVWPIFVSLAYALARRRGLIVDAEVREAAGARTHVAGTGRGGMWREPLEPIVRGFVRGLVLLPGVPAVVLVLLRVWPGAGLATSGVWDGLLGIAVASVAWAVAAWARWWWRATPESRGLLELVPAVVLVFFAPLTAIVVSGTGLDPMTLAPIELGVVAVWFAFTATRRAPRPLADEFGEDPIRSWRVGVMFLAAIAAVLQAVLSLTNAPEGRGTPALLAATLTLALVWLAFGHLARRSRSPVPSALAAIASLVTPIAGLTWYAATLETGDPFEGLFPLWAFALAVAAVEHRRLGRARRSRDGVDAELPAWLATKRLTWRISGTIALYLAALLAAFGQDALERWPGGVPDQSAALIAFTWVVVVAVLLWLVTRGSPLERRVHAWLLPFVVVWPWRTLLERAGVPYTEASWPTLTLWLGLGLIVVAGGFGVARVWRRHRGILTIEPEPDDPVEAARVEATRPRPSAQVELARATTAWLVLPTLACLMAPMPLLGRAESLFIAAVAYGLAAGMTRLSILYWVAGALANIGLGHVWYANDIVAPVWYSIPAGLTLIALSEVQQATRAISRQVATPIRYVGLAVLYGVAGVEALGPDDIWLVLLVAGAALAGFFLGIAFRRRSYAIFGFAVFVIDVLGYLIRKGVEVEWLGAALLFLGGLAILGAALMITLYREQLRQRWHTLVDTLRAWSD